MSEPWTHRRRTIADDYPAWICADCGRKHGVQPSHHVATYHVGDPCGWCGRDDAPVTEPRDFLYPPQPAPHP